MSNVVSLTGRLIEDPQVFDKVTKLNVASNWKDRGGNERTFYAKVAAFGGLGEVCGKYLSKGREVHVIGKLETNKYEDKDGNTRSSVDILADDVRFLGGGNSESNVGKTDSKSNKSLGFIILSSGLSRITGFIPSTMLISNEFELKLSKTSQTIN